MTKTILRFRTEFTGQFCDQTVRLYGLSEVICDVVMMNLGFYVKPGPN